jgi:hypothetical protein
MRISRLPRTTLACIILSASILFPAMAPAQPHTWTRQMGGCRASDGSQGAYDLYRNVSVRSCMSRCLQTGCVAIEYNNETRGCEIHFKEITSVSFNQTGTTYCAIPAPNH